MPYRWICLRLLFLLVLLLGGLGTLRAEVSEPDSPALPADYDEARKAWTLTLPATESNSTYEVFALYEGKVIGKLRVVSYPKQSYKLRLVPVNAQSLGDVSRLSQQLNSIYNKHGVNFTLYEGEGVSAELKAKSESVLVQFKVKRGTIRSLEGIGIAGRNHSRILAQHPLLKEDRSPWALENARFKLENGQVNIALAQGRALEIFNDNIVEYKFIK